MSGKFLAEGALSTVGADSTNNVNSRNRKGARAALRRAVGAWFEQLEARQMLNGALPTVPEDDPNGLFLGVGDVAWVSTTSATHGTVEVEAGGVLYRPAKDYHGPAVFTYGLKAGTTGEIDLTVTPVNDPPTFTLPGNVVATEQGDISVDVTVANAVTNPIVGPADEVAAGQKIDGVAWVEAADPSLFARQPSYDAEHNTITFALAKDVAGPVKILVHLKDDGAEPNVGTQELVITVNGANDAIEADKPIQPQTVVEETPFELVIPDLASGTKGVGRFYDLDLKWGGDNINYSVTLADGSSLPTWLTATIDKEKNTLTLKGKAPDNYYTAQPLQIKVTAIDQQTKIATSTFDLNVSNTNDAPVAVTTIGAQSATQDTAFVLVIPANMFTDPDPVNPADPPLEYNVTFADGTPLPSDFWLKFNAGLLQGIPGNGNVGVISLKVTAKDHGNPQMTGESAAFTITVDNKNDDPRLVTEIQNPAAFTEDKYVTFTVPAETFTDPDLIHGDKLELSATLADGSPLPTWLTFDKSKGTFSGIPAANYNGTLDIKVTATDSRGKSVSDTFQLTISPAPDRPTVVSQILPQAAQEGKEYTGTFKDYFTDPDLAPYGDDVLTFSIKILVPDPLDPTTDKEENLPAAWNSTFDASTAKLVATPTNGYVGTNKLKITATDNQGQSASIVFNLVVGNVNNAPRREKAFLPQAATQGQTLTYQFAADTFSDPDEGDYAVLKYTAFEAIESKDQDGNTVYTEVPLPNWLKFDAATRTFTGIPGPFDVKNITVRVYAEDPDGAKDYGDFAVTVANVDDDPTVGTAIGNRTATEDEQFTFAIPADAFSDPDVAMKLDSFNFSAVRLIPNAGQPDTEAGLPAWLSLDAATGTFRGVPGNGDVGVLKVKVTATSAGKSVSQIFTITVGPKNDAPVVAFPISANGPVVVQQDVQFNWSIPQYTFVDIDTNDMLRYEAKWLVPDSDPTKPDHEMDLPAWLSFNQTSGTFSGKAPVAGNFKIKVTAIDLSNESVSDVFTLKVQGVNSAPYVNKGIADQFAIEDTAWDFVVPADAIVDADGNDTLTFKAYWVQQLPEGKTNEVLLPAEVIVGENKKFWVTFDSAKRQFHFDAPYQNWAGAIDFKVEAIDNLGEKASDTFRLTVLNSNDLPYAAEIGQKSSDEDAAINVSVAGVFGDVDVPQYDQLTYSAVQVAYQLDDKGNVVLDKDGKPVLVKQPLPTWLYFNAATLTFTGTPPADFTTDGKAQYAWTIGDQTRNGLRIEITARDNWGQSISRDMFLRIANVADAPRTGGIQAPSAVEDVAYKFALPAGTFYDVDPGATLNFQAFLVTLANDGKTEVLTDLGVTGTATEWVTFDAAKQEFVGTPRQKHIGASKIRVIALDETHPTALSVSADFILSVAAVNSTPEIQLPAAEPSVNEEGSVEITGVRVNDPDAGSATISVSLTAAHGKLSVKDLPSGVVGVTGNGTYELKLVGSQEQINNNWLSKLVYTPDKDFSGKDAVVIISNDLGNSGAGGTKIDRDTLYVNVNDINDAPKAEADSMTLLELDDKAPAATIIDVLKNDSRGTSYEAAQQLFITGLDGTNAHGTLTPVYDSTLERWVIQYRPEANFNGSASFRYRVTDSQGLHSDFATVDLTVVPVNDAPTFALNPAYANVTNNTWTVRDRFVARNFPIFTGVSAGADNESGQTLVFDKKITSTNPNLFAVAPTFNEKGEISFVLTGEQTGEVTFEVWATDNGGTANNGSDTSAKLTFKMIVEERNDAPLLNDVNLPAIDEDSPYGATITSAELLANARDPEGNTPLVLKRIEPMLDDKGNDLTHAAADGLTLVNGVVTYKPALNYYGAASFYYVVADSLGEEAKGIINVYVRPINNDNPETDGAKINDAVTMKEDNDGLDNGTKVFDVLENDIEANPDKDEMLTIISIVTAPKHGTAVPVLNGTKVAYTPAKDFSGTDSFEYVVTDGTIDPATGQLRTAKGKVDITIDPVNDAPIAADDFFTTVEDSGVNVFPVMANDGEPEGETISFVGNPDVDIETPHGSYRIDSATKSLRYTPDVNFSGTDTFTYMIKDAGGATATATVNVTVNPAIDSETLTVNEKTQNNFLDVLKNDGNAELNWYPRIVSLVVKGVSYGVGSGNIKTDLGTISIAPAGSGLIYTPDADKSTGNETFTYTIDSGDPNHQQPLASATVTVKINQKPVAVADTVYAINQADWTSLNVLGGSTPDIDDEASTLTIAAVSPAMYGEVKISDDKKSVLYKPASSFSGTDSFTYTLVDSNGVTSTATVSLTVTKANDDVRTVGVNSGANTLLVMSNDHKADNATANVSAVQIVGFEKMPSFGQVQITAGGTAITYVPNPNQQTEPGKPDTFQYRIYDSVNNTYSVATVSVNIVVMNRPPVAGNDSFTLNEDAGAQTLTVLANDYDVDGGTLTVYQVSPASHGTVRITDDGKGVIYTPADNYYGKDYFTYQVKDNQGGTATATVSVDVKSVNDAPVARPDDMGPFAEGSSNHYLYVLTNDQQQNPDQLDPNGAWTENLQIIAIPTKPAHGTVVNAGTYLIYTPDQDFAGVDTFEYTIIDNTDNTKTSTARVTVKIDNSNDKPVATEDLFTIEEGATLTLNPADLTANDVDLDHDALTITRVDKLTGGDGKDLTHGKVEIKDGKVIYTPDTDFSGVAVFSYTITDGSKDGSGNLNESTARVTVKVNPINDAPVANDDWVSTIQDHALTFPAGNLIVGQANPAKPTEQTGKDTDVDGDTLAVIGVGETENTHGTVVMLPNGSIQYTPHAFFSGEATFTYTISDGNLTSTATVHVTVSDVNDDPVAVDDLNVVVNEDLAKVIDVLANDKASNPDRDEILTVVSFPVAPLHGSVTVDDKGNAVYTPNENYSGPDTFKYLVADNRGKTAMGTVTLTVNRINDNPVVPNRGDAANPYKATKEEEAVSIELAKLLEGVTDAEQAELPGQVLQVTGWSPMVDGEGKDLTHGTVAIADGKLTFTPAKDFAGVAQFKYLVSDSEGGVGAGVIYVAVTNVNDGPTATPDSIEVFEDEVKNLNPAELVKNDVDPDAGATLTVTDAVSNNPDRMTVVLKNGSIVITPAPNYSGPASFTYTISDGSTDPALTSTAVVTVDIKPVNDAPALGQITGMPENGIIDAGQALRLEVVASDTESNGLIFSLVGQPAGMQISVDPANSNKAVVTWTPTSDQYGTHRFWVRVVDDGTPARDAVQEVNITVKSVPQVAVSVLTPNPVEGMADPVKVGAAITGGPSGSATYAWSATFDGTPVTLIPVKDAQNNVDPSKIGFMAPKSGTYKVTVAVTVAGNTTTATKDVVVADVAPTVQISGETTAVEGSVYTLTIGKTSSDPGADVIQKYWIDWGDGSTPTEVSGAPTENAKVTHAFIDGPLAAQIRVTLQNADGTQSVDVGTPLVVNVQNANPTASFFPGGPVSEGSVGFVTFSNPSDPSSVDRDAKFSYQYDFDNDGTFDTDVLPSINNSITVPARYLAEGPGARTVRGRIYDKDGGYRDYEAVIQITNVAPFVKAMSNTTAGAGVEFVRAGEFTDPGADTWTATVNYGDGSGVQPLELNGRSFTLQHTYAATGVYPVTVTVTDDEGLSSTGQFNVTVADTEFQVSSLTQTSSGVKVSFNRAVDTSVLRLYGAGTNPEVHVTVVGQKTGKVRGSLIWDPSTNTAEFVKTGGVLAADTYTLTLVSNAAGTGWKSTTGEMLDGDADGEAGGNYVASFTVGAASDRILSVPDFARGPNQAVNVPGDGLGLPVRINNANGVFSVDFELVYDSTLLTITDATLAEGLPSGWMIASNLDTPGRAIISISGTTALEGLNKNLVALQATVAAGARYGAAEVIRLENIKVNAGTGTGDVAVHKVAFVGDATGNRGYSGQDASEISKVVVKKATGFEFYPLTDPAIIADVTGDGSLSGYDASFVAQKVAGLARPEIPDLPTGNTLVKPLIGLDPTLNIGDFTTSRGAVLNVPVSVTATEPDAKMSAFQLWLKYDTTRLNLTDADVTLGALVPGWVLTSNVNDAEGLVSVVMFSFNEINVGLGSLVNFAFQVDQNAAATDAPVPFDIVMQDEIAGGTDYTFFNEDDLTVTIASEGSFSLATTNMTVDIAGAPATSNEGAAINLTSSITDATGAVTYAWQVKKGDEVVAQGDQAGLSFTPTDNGVYTVTLIAADEAGSKTVSKTITVDNVAPTATIAGLPAGSVAIDSTVALAAQASDAGSADTLSYLWQVTADNGQTIADGNSQAFSFVPNAAGTYTVTLTVTDDDGAVSTKTEVINVSGGTFRVTSLTANASGFDVQFNRSAKVSGLNLYDGDDIAAELPDVVVIGPRGVVKGSLVWNAATNTATFVATGGVLPAGEYKVRLASRADAWVDADGLLLDGDSNGTAGGDYTTKFSIAAANSAVVSIPDFARGPGQAANVPATSQGLPIRISNAAGLTSVSLVLDYDPALLNISAASVAAGLPADWTSVADLATPGRVVLSASGTTPLQGGQRNLFALNAAVPAGASYGAAQVLRISDLQLNGGSMAGVADQAVQVAAFVGDSTGNKAYTGSDASLISRVVLRKDSGFDAYPTVDPVIVGDASANGSLSSLDASYVGRKAAGLAQAQIPDLPASKMSAKSLFSAKRILSDILA